MRDRTLLSGEITALAILRRVSNLVHGYPVRLGGWTAALILAGFVVDAISIGWDYVAAANFFLSVLTLVAQFWLTKSILSDLPGGAARNPRFFAFVGLGIIATLGIFAGLILLIVPGIILMIRWSLGVPILLSSDEEGVFDSLGRSWRETGPHFWAILLVYLAIYGPALAGAMLGVIVEGSARENIIGTILFEVALSVGLVLGWLAAIAIHCAVYDVFELQEVFE